MPAVAQIAGDVQGSKVRAQPGLRESVCHQACLCCHLCGSERHLALKSVGGRYTTAEVVIERHKETQRLSL